LLGFPSPLVPHQETSLRVSRRDGILLLELNAPDSFPRLTHTLLFQLRSQILSFRDAPDITGVVITGTHICFSAGAELAEVAALRGPQAARFAALGQSVMSAIESSPKPIIAAIRGFCMGGGFDLALACRVRVAATDAVFAHRGAALGIMTGWGGTQRLARAVGPGGQRIAMELMVTGRSVKADEALALRLLSRVVPADHVLDEATKLAAPRNELRPL
jgi:enoyl-CoA hydratase/carnithine racemase